ncbi:BRO-N domain-containing protein [Streptomyces sp. bgisy100]|uniref:BRO-N domain-containing protein n=1 Tax=Streptomyces sp. bgisy100 TaxID=3413783 RepID=UPI003D755D0C
MSERGESSVGAPEHDAIDVDDFVYAATGARVRRLTMPGGEHWFPAAEVAEALGYPEPLLAVARLVPGEHTATLDELARSVAGSDALRAMAGQAVRERTGMVSLQGLVLLVGGCAEPAAQPFRSWIAEVVHTVQRDGGYVLAESEVQPRRCPGRADGPRVRAVPDAVIDAITGLEQRRGAFDHGLVPVRREGARTRREGIDAQLDVVRSMARIADSLERIARRMRSRSPKARPGAPALSTEAVLTDWRERLALTEEVDAVAAHIVPHLVRSGEMSRPLESIAARTGLSVDRVRDCLHFLLRRDCIRRSGVTAEGTPVYVLGRRGRPGA